MSDRVMAAFSEDRGLLVRAASTAVLANGARQIHGCSPTATAALGRALTAAALMGSLLKGDQTVLLQWRGSGPLGPVVAEGRPDLAVRGYVSNPAADVLSRGGKIDVGAGVGTAGDLVVVKDFGLKDPYVSTVPLQTGEMGDDLAYYLLTSEQVPSAVGLGVHVAADYTVTAAGGILVEVLPGCDADALNRVAENLTTLAGVTESLASGGVEALLARALEGVRFQAQDLGVPRIHCACGPDRLEATLVALGPREAENLLEAEGEIRVRCAFCAAQWRKRSLGGEWERAEQG
jgi:molecular chaperone Hsp33